MQNETRQGIAPAPSPSGTPTPPLLQSPSRTPWREQFLRIMVALLPAAAIPLAWFPLTLGKTALIYAGLAGAIALGLFAGIRRRQLVLPRGGALAVFLLPCAYFIAALFSSAPGLSWFGGGFEVDTFFFASCVAAAFLLGYSMLGGALRGRTLYAYLFWGILALLLIQALHLIIPLGDAFSLLGFPTANLAGRWNDVGIFAGLLALLSLVRFEWSQGNKERMISGAALAVALLALILVRFDMALYALAGVALLLAGISRLEGSGKWRGSLSFGVACLTVLFLFVGSSLHTRLAGAVGVSHIEARPSLSSTVAVGLAAAEADWKRWVVGSGPNTFTRLWQQYKPAEINASLFWGVDFESGFSTLATAGIATGALGTLAILVLLAGLCRSCFALGKKLKTHGAAGVAALVATLFLLALAFMYPLSQTALIILALSAGVAVSLGREHAQSVLLSFSGMRGALLLGGATIACIGAALLSGVPLASALVRDVTIGRTVLLYNETRDLDRAEARLAGISSFAGGASVERLRTLLALERMNRIAGEQAEPDEAVRARFTAATDAAILRGIAAVNAERNDYRNWVALASLYARLAELGVNGAYENARELYTEASSRNPTNPELHLRIARLDALQNKPEDFRASIERSLALKPNYADAILLVVQFEVARRNTPGAIAAAEALAITLPRNPSVWFELGLLKYSIRDFAGARVAFEQALTIAPQYANAQYFLGLAYHALENRVAAQAVFENLSRENPNNAEVQMIRENLRAGKEPFAGFAASNTPPEKREKAPIEE